MEGALTHIMSLPLLLSWRGTASELDYQTSSMWCSFHSHPLGHVHLIKQFHVLHLIFPIHEQNVSPVPPTALSHSQSC